MRTFLIQNINEFIQILKDIHFTRMVNRMMFFFSHQFSPKGASRRLSSAALLRACNSLTMASPLSALHMKVSDSCKIQVISFNVIDIECQLNLGIMENLFVWSIYAMVLRHILLHPQPGIYLTSDG